MFGVRRVLEDISETLHRMETRLDSRIEQESESTRATIEQESNSTRALIANNTQVIREILIELQEHRPVLERIDHGVQANTEGLMHVLDELRNGPPGPGTAPAT